MIRVRFRAAEHGKNSVPDEFVDGSIVREDFRAEYLEIIVEHLNHYGGIVNGSRPGEPAQIGKKDRDPGLCASGLEASGSGLFEELVAYGGGKVGEKMLQSPVVLLQTALQELVGDGGSGIMGH